MNKRTFQFQCRIEQIKKILAYGPMTYDQLYKACGFDPQGHIKAMTKEGSMQVRKEPFGNNGNFTRSLYYIETAPEPVTEDINGFSDRLRVMMGYIPMKRFSIDGKVTIFDDEEYFERHADEIRNQAPCIGHRSFGSMQSSFNDFETYGAA